MKIVYVVLIFIFILIAAIVLYNLYERNKRKIEKEYRDFVFANSSALKMLNDLNKRYAFHTYSNFNQYHKYDNQDFYNDISCQDYLIYSLKDLSPQIKMHIDKINKNAELYKNYLDERTAIELGHFDVPIGELDYKKLLVYEKNIFERNTQNPPIKFDIYVILYRTDFNGRVYERKIQAFSQDEILSIIKRLKNKNGRFYNDRDIWDALCRVERGNVSNKLRFSIYERDRYRCRRCGRSEYNGCKLEIDHIVPISKGGKSTPDNLQTLCRDCNYSKGNSTYY